MQLRIFLSFAGFLGGFVLFVIFQKKLGMLATPAFAGLVFGGAYLLQLAASSAVAAACPECGGAASTAARSPFVYACRDCQAKTNAGMALLGGEAAIQEQIAIETKEQPSQARRFAWIFMFLGVVAVGLGAFVGIDSIRLVRDGVSVTAQVVRVTVREGRDQDGNHVLNYTDHIRYTAAQTPLTLEHSWSQSRSSGCIAGCYNQGELLKVIYLPADPATAKVHSVVNLYLFPAIPILIGLVFIAVSVVTLRNKAAVESSRDHR